MALGQRDPPNLTRWSRSLTLCALQIYLIYLLTYLLTKLLLVVNNWSCEASA